MSDIEFRLLGPLEVRVSGAVAPIGGARPRILLSMLLLDPGRVASLERLVDAVWEDTPPTTARTQVQICVSELRRTFDRLGHRDLIVTRAPGYLIRVADESIDVLRFRRLVGEGRAAAGRGEPAAAGRILREALALHRGDALAGVGSRTVRAAAVRLHEERLAVLEECLDLELELGRHRDLVGELRALVAEHPLREKLYAQLMLALYRDGRHAEALAEYRGAHRMLAEDHGIDPSEGLRSLERAILGNDPALDLPASDPGPVVPSQLPAPPADFVSREALLAAVRGRLRGADRAGAHQVPVVVASGPGGSGKSVVALQAAHQVRESFPDGQLYAHLRGTDARPARPEQLLDRFLRALGVPPPMLPSDLDGLAAMYRSRTAHRRLLIVLDDAQSSAQVLPLIPGDPRCAVLVTSRSPLTGLPGAHRFDIGVFEPHTSLELLTSVVGRQRVRAEPAAAAELAESCGHLPLALRIAAAKLAVRPHWPISQMVSRLRDERQRLDELTLDGSGVRTSLAMSYETLDPRPARLLLLLSLLGATDFAAWVAWPLLGERPRGGADPLDDLVGARLVEVHSGGGAHTRYRLHNLTWIFTRELLASEVPAAEWAPAQHRLLQCWLFLAGEAHRREYGGDFTVLHSAAPRWELPDELVGELLADPVDWLQCEHDNLISAVEQAAELDLPALCWDLAVTATTLFEARSYRHAWRDTHEVAMDAVRRAGDLRGEAVLRYSRGGLALLEKRLDDAQQDLLPALAWFTGQADRHGVGLVAADLALIERLQGRYETARERAETAVSALHSVGDLAGEAHALRNLALIHHEQDRPELAERQLREALATADRSGSRRVQAQIQHALGDLLLGQDKLSEAEEAFTAVLRAVEHRDDPGGKAYALLGLGSIGLARAELAQAGAQLAEALAAARRAGNRFGQGRILLTTARWALASGDMAAAAIALNQSERLFQAIGAPAWLTRVSELRNRLAEA